MLWQIFGWCIFEVLKFDSLRVLQILLKKLGCWNILCRIFWVIFNFVCIPNNSYKHTLFKEKNLIHFLSVFLPPSSLSIVLGSALRNPKSWQRLIRIRSLPGPSSNLIRQDLPLKNQRIPRARRTAARLMLLLRLWKTWRQRKYL